MAKLGLDSEVLTAAQSSPHYSQQEMGEAGCSAEGELFQGRGCFIPIFPGLVQRLAHSSYPKHI